MDKDSEDKDCFTEGNFLDKFVFHVPEWQGELLFSKEVLVFVGVILLVIAGTLFCFLGYKYFKTILFLGIGTVVCYGSYLLVEPMTPKLVIRMFLTVSLTFLGLCFAYFLDIIFVFILDRMHIRNALGKRTYLLAAPLGAAILGLTIYYFIWRDAITAIVTALVCLAVGLPFQYAKRKKQVRFRTYNDLLRLSRPEVNADSLEPVALGTVAAMSAAPAIIANSEPEPEPVVAAVEPEPEMEPEPVAAIVEPEPEAEPDLLVVRLAPEPEVRTELPTELSDAVKELIHKKMESEEDVLEDALFVKQISELVKAEKKERAAKNTAAKAVAAATQINASSGRKSDVASHHMKITVTSKHGRKSRKKRRKNLIAKAVTVMDVGLGHVLAGRTTKGRD